MRRVVLMGFLTVCCAGQVRAAAALDAQEQAVAQQCPTYQADREIYYRTIEALPPDPNDPSRFIAICKEFGDGHGTTPAWDAFEDLVDHLDTCRKGGAVGAREVESRFVEMNKARHAHCQ